MKIAHIALVVRDMEKSIDFYSRVLGGRIIDQSSNDRLRFTYFDVGGQVIELLKYVNTEVEKRKTGTIDHIAFFVDDLEKEVNRLKGLNVNLLFDEPREVNNWRIIFFTGPDGERIEYMEKL